MRPIGKYIIINTIEEEMETSSGILLSSEDAYSVRFKIGKVVSSGTDGEVFLPDEIIFSDESAGHTMMIKDTQYTIIREHDVVVVE